MVLMSELERVTHAVGQIANAIEERDIAMRAARETGQTWQAIADAARMTPHGVRYALGVKRDKPTVQQGLPMTTSQERDTP